MADRRRRGSRWPARCASTAASTRRSPACCSPTSPSRSSTTSSKGRCAIRRASTSPRPPRSARPTCSAACPASTCTGASASASSSAWRCTCWSRAHHVRLRPAHRRRQRARGAAGRACRSAALVLAACALGGAAAGLAGMVEVAAVHGSANASLDRGLRLRRHPRRVHRPPESARHRAGRGARRRHLGERRHAAAAARPARRDRARAAGHRVHADPRPARRCTAGSKLFRPRAA